MQTTYRLQEILVNYKCESCGKTEWKSNKGKTKLYPNRYEKNCENLACPSHTKIEDPTTEETEIQSGEVEKS